MGGRGGREPLVTGHTHHGAGDTHAGTEGGEGACTLDRPRTSVLLKWPNAFLPDI